MHVRRHHIRQICQTRQRDIAYRHVGTHACRHAGRSRTDDTAAYDQHLRRLDARDTAQKYTAAAARTLQIVGTLLYGHTPRDFRHGNKQRKRTVVARNGLVGAADGARIDHGTRQGFTTCKVEISEEQLTLAYERILGLDRLLYLHDHLGRSIYLLDRGKNLNTGSDVILIRKTAVFSGRSLHIDRVSAPRKFVGAGRRKSNSILVVLDLLRNTNNHTP